IPAASAAVQAFLSTAVANDIVDPHPNVTNDAPPVLPIGTTKITFTATDASGNSTSASAVLTVKPPPPPGTPQPPPPVVDRTPPDDVSGVKATAGDRLVKLTWKVPTEKDFEHVEIVRSTAAPGAAQAVVYTGKGKTFS